MRSLIHAYSPRGHIKALGCSFQWNQATDRDTLDLFLYGSDLQWRMNRFGERQRTPLEWIGGGWRRGAHANAGYRWQSDADSPYVGVELVGAF